MQRYSCSVSNFSELADKFLLFCASAYDNYDWTLLRRKYDDYYGATVAIPLADYRKNTDMVTPIYIIESECCYRYSRWDSVTRRVYPTRHLYNILKYIYPNATISCKIINTIDGTVKARNIIDTAPSGSIVYLNFSSIERQLSNISDLKSYLDVFSNACMVKGLDLYLGYADISLPVYNGDLAVFLENYIYEDMPRKIINFSEYIRHLDDLTYAITDNAIYRTDNYDGLGLDSSNSVKAMSPYIYKLYTRYILNQVFKIAREEYYLSIMYNKIESNTYYKFLHNYSKYMSEEFNIDATNHGRRSLRSKYGPNNPFKHVGQMMSVGIHTSYDPELWMCEQGGITCKYEEDLQVNDANLLDFWIFDSGVPLKQVKIPYYPTTGCPWITISNENISDYGIGTDNKIHAYFTRYDYGGTITIRVSDKNGVKPDIWQNIVFGKFNYQHDTFNINQYYCAGGNTALCPDVWKYYAESWIDGYSYDLDMKNSSLVNSNILYTAKFQKGTFTNFRVNTGDGQWQDLYQVTQHYKRYNYLQENGIPYAPPYYGVPLTKPAYVTNSNLHTSFVDWHNKIDTYRIKESYSHRKYMTSPIAPLTVYFNW